MSETPLRHMLFLTVLLFVILSSGSLQCALNCCARTGVSSSCTPQVADCHPLPYEVLIPGPASTLCHHNHPSSQTQNEPTLISLNGGNALALLGSHREEPEYHSADPIPQQYAVFYAANLHTPPLQPLSQTDKQRRSTILLM
ncbi:hypothetical protein [Geopsychrobacter electrodiphilus]|uniref:hypothetical protein n=1 Tax=Geopsychrobacter electrodiphilus TaxID=225196 RepID=UPI00037825A3|nr:hypothetical protein [Geopsychrobacter electrodiphilus]